MQNTFFFIVGCFLLISPAANSLNLFKKVRCVIKVSRYIHTTPQSPLLKICKDAESLKRCKNHALNFLNNSMHVDPELGDTWRACQVTAASSIIDFHNSHNDNIEDSVLARYFLDVGKTGAYLQIKDLKDKIQALGIDGEISQGECRRAQKSLIEFLRKDQAIKLGIELEEKNGEYVIVDKKDAFIKSIEILKKYKPKIVLAVYPGTPTLTEVRSLKGAQWLVPFVYEEDERWVLDKSGEIQVRSNSKRTITSDGSIEVANGGRVVIRTFDSSEKLIESVGSGKSNIEDHKLPLILSIPQVCSPNKGESCFVLHMGMPIQNHNLIDHELGNIISKIGLTQFDPIKFMKERFFMLQEKTENNITTADLDNLSFSHLSLFHFSHIFSYNEDLFSAQQITLPNYIEINGITKKYRPVNSEHHALYVLENVSDVLNDPGDYGTTLYKAESGFRYTLRIVVDDQNKPDLHKSYFVLEKLENGQYGAVDDQKIATEKMSKFLDSLGIYHTINFCLRTRVMLNEGGLTLSNLQELKAQGKLLLKEKSGLGQ